MFGFTEHSFLFFGLEITYYGFIIAIGMAVGVFVACKNAKLRGLTVDDLILAACYVLPLAIIGARIYYVIFSEQTYTFAEVFRIWDGGMAIYGGVIGGAIGVMLFCLIHKKNFLDVADIAAPSLILGQAIGRIGCYFAGCCYGIEVTQESLMWFPLSTQINGVWHLSTFFYESLWNIMIFILLLILLRKNKMRYRGSIVALYLIGYGTGRAWIEALRGDSLYLGSIKVSQLLSIILVISGIAVILVNYILVKKGKCKDIAQLQPLWQENIKLYEIKIKEEKEKRLKKKNRNISDEKNINNEEKEDNNQKEENKNK